MPDQEELYLIQRARQKGDSQDHEANANAQAFLVTSKIIYPHVFTVQYEIYDGEKERNNEKAAAKTFTKLFQEFGSKRTSETAKLWAEVDQMVELLASESRNEESFLKKIFTALDSGTQRELLLSAAFQSSDPVEKAKRLLLVLKKFPDLILKHGGHDTLNFMVDICKSRVRKSSHVDEMLILLITEAAPLIMPMTNLQLDSTTLNDVLLLTFEYIFATLMSNAKDKSLPWKDIVSLYYQIGLRLGWSIAEIMNGKDDYVGLYHQLLAFHQGSAKTKPNEDVPGEIFYLASLMLFKSLAEYSSLAQGNLEGNNGAILVEAFITHEGLENEPLMKRRRTTEDERKLPSVTHGDDGDPNLVEAFLSAVKYYDLIAADQVLLQRLQKLVRPPESLVLPFFVDIALYQGRFRDSLQTLRHLPAPTTAVGQCRNLLKSASLCYAMGDNQSMVDQIWQCFNIVANCKPSEDEGLNNSKSPKESRKGKSLTVPTSKLRHVHFLDFNRQSIISYATRVLIYSLKERVLQPIAKNDLAIGHVVVLLQYCYPQEEDFVSMIIHKIKVSDAFTYPIFMRHVTHIEFLEMFSNIMTESSVTLDIAPTLNGAPAASSASTRRLGTRGANRGEKNEIKTAIKKQASSRAYDNLDEVIIDFVNRNRDTLFSAVL